MQTELSVNYTICWFAFYYSTGTYFQKMYMLVVASIYCTFYPKCIYPFYCSTLYSTVIEYPYNACVCVIKVLFILHNIIKHQNDNRISIMLNLIISLHVVRLSIEYIPYQWGIHMWKLNIITNRWCGYLQLQLHSFSSLCTRIVYTCVYPMKTEVFIYLGPTCMSELH